MGVRNYVLGRDKWNGRVRGMLFITHEFENSVKEIGKSAGLEIKVVGTYLRDPESPFRMVEFDTRTYDLSKLEHFVNVLQEKCLKLYGYEYSLFCERELRKFNGDKE